MLDPQLIALSVDHTPTSPGASGDDRGLVRDSTRVDSTLPTDLLDQVRGRIRLLALLILVGFGFDPLLFGIRWAVAVSSGEPVPGDIQVGGVFQLAALGAAAASFALWLVARDRRISSRHLLTLGLAYEIAICFVIGLTDNWQYFLEFHHLPSMTWIPAVVIMFPLLLPGPPRRILPAAILAGGMGPFAILLLERLGRIQASPEAYFNSAVHSLFAVGFAYVGARTIYGLGQEVVKARELGSYHLGTLLGRGGMGEVYRATHRMLARPAAIKLIRPEALGTGAEAELAVKRFRREAEVAASLRSPHTVELYDFGVTRDRTFYFVMELLEGLDLESLVRLKGPVPAGRVIHILRQVCQSLAEAHARGLVHRDIKPANIHIGRLGLSHDFVKVLDFGLVKSVAVEQSKHSLATAAGFVAGTPAYMAPEMALAEGVDGRADLYALGCVAYYLLSGEMVFEAANPLQMIARHMQERPVPLRERTELPVPPALEALVLACLAKSPADRPVSALALSAALGSIEVEPWAEEQAAAWWAMHRPG